MNYFTLFALLTSLSAYAQNTPKTADKSLTVKIKDSGFGQLFVPTSIDGKKEMSLLDTGARWTSVVESREYQSYRINGFVNVTSVWGDSKKVNTINARKVILAGQNLTNHRIAKMNEGYANGSRVGMESLEGFCFSLDVKNNNFSLETKCEKSTSLPIQRTNGRLIAIEGKIEEQTIQFVFDTGAEISVLDRTLKDSLTQHLKKSNPVSIRDSSNSLKTKSIYTVSMLRFGSTELKNIPVVFANLSKLNINSGSSKVLGIIGFHALKKHQWTFDLKKNKYAIH